VICSQEDKTYQSDSKVKLFIMPTTLFDHPYIPVMALESYDTGLGTSSTEPQDSRHC
jgi:hypothetical protein